MKHLSYFLFLLTFIFSLASCQKNTEAPEQGFVEKPVHIFDQEIGIPKIMTFIEALNSDFREDFSDTEINEGKWLLEATGNYLTNINSDGTFTDMEELSATITTVEEDGTLKMVGSSMTDKFQEILDAVAAKETADGVVAVGMDVKFVEVADNSADLNFVVMYKKGTAVDPPYTFPEAFYVIQDNIAARIADFRDGCVEYFSPELHHFYQDPPVWTLGSRESHYVDSEIADLNNLIYGGDAEADSDADLFFDIALDFAADPVNYITIESTNTGELQQYTPDAVTGIGAVYLVRTTYGIYGVSENPNSALKRYRFVVDNITLSGITWCY